MPIGIEGWIPLYRNIDITEVLRNEDDTSPSPINVITAISFLLHPLPPTTPFPTPKLEMTPEEELVFISKLFNDPSTFFLEVPVKETIGKLGPMHPRAYSLDHPAIPLLCNYAQHGCPVDCSKYWTLEQIILMFKQGPHVSSK